MQNFKVVNVTQSKSMYHQLLFQGIVTDTNIFTALIKSVSF